MNGSKENQNKESISHQIGVYLCLQRNGGMGYFCKKYF
jgi:hypothetical protein